MAVIVQGTNTSRLWLPLAGNRTVDLTVTAPGLVVMSSTPAGPIVFDGHGDMTHEGVGAEPYLAEISDAGELTRAPRLPGCPTGTAISSWHGAVSSGPAAS